MARQIREDGDRWSVRLGAEPPERGTRTLVFFPETCDQRPFRVVEVPEDLVASEEALEALPERELRELYQQASSMGFPHDYA